MIVEKRKAKDERTIKVFEKEKIQLLRGPYGPYIKQGLRNYKLTKEQQEKVESLTIEEVNAIIEELKANPPRKVARRKKAS
ncbi:MAG: topoisomerase C-terminal repeat-containing protein, partial [Sediminibacterium sp.]